MTEENTEYVMTAEKYKRLLSAALRQINWFNNSYEIEDGIERCQNLLQEWDDEAYNLLWSWVYKA